MANETNKALSTNGETDFGSRIDSFCTFAVTGTETWFQPIFICHDCLDEESGEASPLCVCQACAELCHENKDHDVEYIGMGPSYCDCCRVGSCCIFEASQEKASELLGDYTEERQASNPTQSEPHHANKSTKPLQEVFHIPDLHAEEVRSSLVREAEELIQHSKETFWLDSSIMERQGDICMLERLAWCIYLRHFKHYDDIFSEDEKGGGAEWWVQIKDAGSVDGGIDLHYDKDEALAETFGLAFFPTLSTVSYLTSSPDHSFNPTIVFDHTYDRGEDELIDSMLVSKPCIGKHLVFDGKLLHGAPAHQDFRSWSCSMDAGISSEIPPDGSKRVTFLVNLWKKKPAKVLELPSSIRRSMWTSSAAKLNSLLDSSAIEMSKLEISEVSLASENDLPEALRHRIEMAFFVSKGPTQGSNMQDHDGDIDTDDGEGEDEGGLVMVSFPPPPMTGSMKNTLLVKFGANMQAYLDYPDSSNDQGNATNKPPRETAYV